MQQRSPALGSSENGLLVVPRIKQEAGKGALGLCTPSMGNALPDELRSIRLYLFQVMLKTFLFSSDSLCACVLGNV